MEKGRGSDVDQKEAAKELIVFMENVEFHTEPFESERRLLVLTAIEFIDGNLFVTEINRCLSRISELSLPIELQTEVRNFLTFFRDRE